jgi:hypothetical protein
MTVFSTLMKELARRGHQVTVFSPFPEKYPIQNFTDIEFKLSYSELLQNSGEYNLQLQFKFYIALCKLTRLYVGFLISNAHSGKFCQWSIVAMRAQCVLVATSLLHSGGNFHSFFYNGSKTVRVNMESCYGGMSMGLKQRAVTEF